VPSCRPAPFAGEWRSCAESLLLRHAPFLVFRDGLPLIAELPHRFVHEPEPGY
jgi:hypothetical protein